MTARVAIVTGASSGIGLGITRALLERGCRVVANSRTISDSKDLRASASLDLVDGQSILTVNFLLSTLVFWIAARIYVLPKLRDLPPRVVLLPILVLHAFRHLGLMFLAPGATFAGMPLQFAYPAALGDLLASVLAIAAIPAVAMQSRGWRLLVWLFNIEGTLDLCAAIALANIYDAAVYMGPAYWIPAFWVPALLVTHYITFIVLHQRVSAAS